MKRTIRLTEAELTRIVRRVIQEQNEMKPPSMNAPVSPTGVVKPNPPKPAAPKPAAGFRGKTVNLYKDQGQTKFYRRIQILQEPRKDYGGEVRIEFGSDQELTYNCTRPNMFKMREPASMKEMSYYVFNNKLAQEFYGKFCQRNPSLQSVPKSDYVQNGTQPGSNVA